MISFAQTANGWMRVYVTFTQDKKSTQEGGIDDLAVGKHNPETETRDWQPDVAPLS